MLTEIDKTSKDCITCGLEHQHKFCPNCGEPRLTKKITFSSIIEDTFSSVINMDRGILFNIKSLIVHPKKITLDYVSGKRKGVLNPISFLVLSITLYLIILNYIHPPKKAIDLSDPAMTALRRTSVETGHFLREYIKYFWILSVAPLALSLRIFFHRVNFFEHMGVSSFIIAQSTFVGIISYFIFRAPLIFDPVVYLLIIILGVRIFSEKNRMIESFLSMLGVMALFVIQLILIVACIGLIKYYL